MDFSFSIAELFGGETGMILAAIGAALAIALPGVGSARAVGDLGRTAGALVKEKPDVFGQAIVLQLMGASQGLYGFVIGLLIILEIQTGMDVGTGFYYLVAALPITITGYFSAPAQAEATMGSFQILAQRPENYTQGIIFSAMVETYAILGFVGSLLMILFL